MDAHPRVVAKALQLMLPRARAMPVASARIGGDEQLAGVRSGSCPSPPTTAAARLQRTKVCRGQWRLRVAASHRVNQLLQRLLDAWLRLLDARSSGARTANPTALGPARFQLPAPLADGRARQACRVRNQSIASIPDSARFGGCPDTTSALIEIRLDRRVLLNDCRLEFKIASHQGSRIRNPSDDNVIYASLLMGDLIFSSSDVPSSSFGGVTSLRARLRRDLRARSSRRTDWRRLVRCHRSLRSAESGGLVPRRVGFGFPPTLLPSCHWVRPVFLCGSIH